MTTYHAIMTPTFTGTKSSARKAAELKYPVRIIVSGTIEECFYHIEKHTLGSAPMNVQSASDDSVLVLPIKVDPNWTYRIIPDGTSGEPRKEDNTDLWEHMEKHAQANILEWFDLIVRRFEDGIRDFKNKREDFQKSCDGVKNYSTPSDVVSFTLSDITNTMNNLRLDLGIRHAADLRVARSHLKKDR